MTHWPEQPVNIIIQWLKDHSPSLVVADFGCGEILVTLLVAYWSCKFIYIIVRICYFSILLVMIITLHYLTGDARLSRSVKNKVFSFDLVAHNSSVVACDMANVCPLPL